MNSLKACGCRWRKRPNYIKWYLILSLSGVCMISKCSFIRGYLFSYGKCSKINLWNKKQKKNPITSLVCEFIGGGELSERVCVWGVNGVNADCYCTLIVIFHIFSCLVSFKHGCSISVKIKQTLLGWAVTPGRLMCIQLSPPHLKMHIFKCMHKLGIAHVSLLHFYKKKNDEFIITPWNIIQGFHIIHIH